MSNWKSKTFAWWVTVAVLVWSAGYFGLGSDFLEGAYAAPVSSSHATADMMSPILAEKLEHSIKGLNDAGLFYTGVAQETSDSIDPVQNPSFNVSFCIASYCAGILHAARDETFFGA